MTSFISTTCRKADDFMITIAIPVYNEINYIEYTLKSVSRQEISLVYIYDNASNDGTTEICEKYAKCYPHIKHIRHSQNLGGQKNFLHALSNAKTEYFMWLGGHDALPDGYIDNLLDAFKGRPDAVLAHCPVKYIGESGDTLSYYQYSNEFINDLSCTNPFKRVASLVKNLTDFTLIQGLYRTEVLKRLRLDILLPRKVNSPWVVEFFPASEHLFFCRTAAAGPIVYSTSTYYIRREFRKIGNFTEDLKRSVRAVTNVNRIEIPKQKHLFRQVQGGILGVLRDIPSEYNERMFWTLTVKKMLAQRYGIYYENL